MADSAVARLRGILARDHDAATIDQLLTDVFAEHNAAEQPIPDTLVEPTERPRWTDTSTYRGFALACLICPFETEPWERPGQAAGVMEQHFVNVHGRGSTQHGTVTLSRPDGSTVPLTVHLAIDKATLAVNMLGPIRRAIKGGR